MSIDLQTTHSHRRYQALCLIFICLLTGSLQLSAEPQVFRMGTGGSAGTYFQIGSLIAESISDHGDKNRATSYRVPELLALAQRSTGSVANIREIEEGLLEAGLAQADASHWAYHGQGPFSTETRREKLRTVATLYLESLHLVARTGSGIAAVDDLVGLRVALDEVGSGTLLEVRPLLNAYQITMADIKPVYLKLSDAIDRLRNNKLDAFFVVAGYPVAAVSRLVHEGHATVIPITGPIINDLLQDYPFITTDTIPVGTYNNASEINTLAVAAQLIVSADLDADLVYGVTGMLWSKSTLEYLATGHPKGQQLALESALLGNTVPVHEGARRYYKEVGLDPGDANAPTD